MHCLQKLSEAYQPREECQRTMASTLVTLFTNRNRPGRLKHKRHALLLTAIASSVSTCIGQITLAA